ncbi:MAG TPA: thioredoxin-dependent thiol peroxidase [Polyangiaceae bacterium]|nr:thioredoxin-dependent thiol peroxidase [Polyangiaceae bacterium]
MAAKKSKAKVNPPSKTTATKAAKAKVVKAVKAVKAVKVVKAVKANAPAKPEAEAATSNAGLAEGSKAPAFALPDESGSVLDSASLAGKPYVIYFYPKDDTPGCTKEACDFRDNIKAFNSAKVRVLGVSPDDSKRHAKFKEKYGLNFTLLSDVDKTLITKYGIWVKKLNYGREYMGVQRSTFLIDKAGKIAKAWNGVRVPGHVEAVLAAL